MASHILDVFVVLLFAVHFKDTSVSSLTIPASLINTKTNTRFTDILIDKLTHDLIDIAHNKREKWLTYKANDVAAVQAIRSLERSLFELSAYFAQNRSALSLNKYLSGIAIEFATTRCDYITSNRFPRSTKPLIAPWNTHKDHFYYDVDCRRNATDISSNKYKPLHAEIRVKRSLSAKYDKKLSKRQIPEPRRRARKSIIDPSVCGKKVFYQGLTGNITSPGYPGNYSAGISCVWHIMLPVKYAVKISFDLFSFEHDKRCLFDSLEFFDGSSTSSKSIGRFCGTTIPVGVRSSLNVLTIKMTTDDTIERNGFVIRWNYTDPNFPHPGYLVTSNIIVDQLGPTPNDLKKFDLVFDKPTTCPLRSNDEYCFFQYESLIISRIISTTTLPEMKMNSNIVEVIFDHIIDLKSFPTLYNAKKYCMRWNDTILFTDGAWTRYGGQIYRSDAFSTTCHFEKPGIFAVIAEHHFEEEPIVIRFTGSFYAGIFFAVIWLILLMCQWAFSRRINVPEWINFNQALSLALFLGVVLCGLHLHFDKSYCSLLAFLLYYFGLGVFFWQFLKAAQLSGKFDDFFARGRNIYLFYFLLGWTLPMFIAGMAGGAMFFPREQNQSCWAALVGGSIWGYTSPTYFLVLANLLILYKVSKKTKKNLSRFNHPEVRKRVVRELMQIILYVLTWVFGILCTLNKTIFSLQYLFCLSLTLSVLLMTLGGRQRRPGYQKIHYENVHGKTNDSKEETKEEKKDKKVDQEKTKFMFTQTLSMKAYKKWKKFRKYELRIAKSFAGPLNRGNLNKAYDMLEEEGSKVSVKTATSVRTESVLSSEKYDETSDPESELQLSSSDEDETATSRGSRLEVTAEVILSSSRRSKADLEYQMTEHGEEDEQQDDGEIVNDDANQSRQESASLAHDMERQSTEIQDSKEEEIDEDGQNMEEPEEKDSTKREGSSVSLSKEDSNDVNGQSDDEQQETTEENNRDTEEPEENAHQEEAEMKADDLENDEEQEDLENIPKVTVNAFGGTPIDDGSEMQLPPQRTPIISRAHSTKAMDVEAMSVCSLGDEDEEEHDDHNAVNDSKLHDISVFE